MDKPEKLKTTPSVPDIVFIKLKTDREERVIGFVENDSEEHFGKLVRKGGEILLPGVYPHKTRLPEELSKPPTPRARKDKVRADAPTSDTDLETLLFYQGSSGELRCLANDERTKKKNRDEDIRSDTSEVVLQTEQLVDAREATPEDSATRIMEDVNEKKSWK